MIRNLILKFYYYIQTILFNSVDFNNTIAINYFISLINNTLNESEFSAVNLLIKPISLITEVTFVKDTSIINPYSI